MLNAAGKLTGCRSSLPLAANITTPASCAAVSRFGRHRVGRAAAQTHVEQIALVGDARVDGLCDRIVRSVIPALRKDPVAAQRHAGRDATNPLRRSAARGNDPGDVSPVPLGAVVTVVPRLLAGHGVLSTLHHEAGMIGGDTGIDDADRHTLAGIQIAAGIEMAHAIDVGRIDRWQLDLAAGLERQIALQSRPEGKLRIHVEALDLLAAATERQGDLALRVGRSLRTGALAKSVNATTMAPATGAPSFEEVMVIVIAPAVPATLAAFFHLRARSRPCRRQHFVSHHGPLEIDHRQDAHRRVRSPERGQIIRSDLDEFGLRLPDRVEDLDRHRADLGRDAVDFAGENAACRAWKNCICFGFASETVRPAAGTSTYCVFFSP